MLDFPIMGIGRAGALLAALMLLSRGAVAQEAIPGRIVIELTDAGARALRRGELTDLPAVPGAAAASPSIRPLFTAREGPLSRFAVLTFRLPAGAGPEANAPWLRTVREWSAVRQAESDRAYPAAALPDDPYLLGDGGLPRQFQLHNPGGLSLRGSGAWPFLPAGRTVTVAILDTGVDWRHPDLGGALPPGGILWTNTAEVNGIDGVDDDGNGFVDDKVGWDFVDLTNPDCASPSGDIDNTDPDNDPSDYAGHGTEVTGFVTAISGNGEGIAGAAPCARIMPVRVGWRGTTGAPFVCMSFCAQGVEYAARNGAKVINCSWNSGDLNGLGAALDLAIQTYDVVVVGSAGNGSTNSTSIQYLASRSDCLGVGGVLADGTKAPASNYGSWVDLAAFYQGPPSTYYSPSTLMSGYRVNPTGGTSFAAPQVTAAAALLRAVDPAATAAEIRTTLVATALPLHDLDPVWGDSLGGGLVDYAAAIRALGGGWDVAAAARGLTPVPDAERLAILGSDYAQVLDGTDGTPAPGWDPGVRLNPPTPDLLPSVAGEPTGALLVWGEDGTTLQAVGLDGSSPPGWPVSKPLDSSQIMAASLDGGNAATLFVPHDIDVLVLTPDAVGVNTADLGRPLRWMAVAPAGADSVATFAGVVGEGTLDVWDQKGGIASGESVVDLGTITAPPIVLEPLGAGFRMGVAVASSPTNPESSQSLVFVAPGGGVVSSSALDAPPIRFLSAIGFAGDGVVAAVAADSAGGIHLVSPSWSGPREVDAGGPLAGEVLGADLDGDDQSDLVALRADGTLLAWDESLTPLAGFPRSFPSGAPEAPVIVDAGGTRSVVVADTAGGLWSLPMGPAGHPDPWPAPRGGPSRCGFLGHDRATPVASPQAALTWNRAGDGSGSLCWSGSGLADGLGLRLLAGGAPVWQGPAADAGCVSLAGRRGGETIRLESLDRSRGWIPVAVLSLPGGGGLRLASAAPNPFRDETRITWSGGVETIILEVFDLAGRRVWERRVPAAAGAASWPGTSLLGTPVPPGLYVLRVADRASSAVRRVVKLR